MAVAELRRELSRRIYVRSRVARTAAVRLAYLAYSRALLRWSDRSSPEAAASLRRRLEELFDEDFRDAEAGIFAADTRGVFVGPLQPGRYEFFDDFHPASRGVLVVR